MVPRALSKAFKLVGTLLIMAFAFQTVVIEAEDMGLTHCLDRHLVSSPENQKSAAQDHATAACEDECCLHNEGIPQSLLSLGFFVPPTGSFLVLDEATPDGPVAAIDQPPRLS